MPLLHYINPITRPVETVETIAEETKPLSTLQYLGRNPETIPTQRDDRGRMWLEERLSVSSKINPKFQMCCSQGKSMIENLKPTPAPISTLLTGTDNRSKEFHNNIQSYNSSLSFSLMSVNLDHRLANMNTGNYTFRIQGSPYHLIGSAMPDQGDQPKFAQIYFYDVEHELDNRARIFPDMNRATLAELNLSNNIMLTAAITPRDNSQPSKISPMQFYSFRMMYRPQTENMLHSFGKLFHQFGVEMYCKMESERLQHQFKRSEEMRVEQKREIGDALHMNDLMNQFREDENENSTGNYMTKAGLKVVLSSSFIGGPRHMAQNYYDAMSIVRRYGKPDLFVTFTCNPFWPEIQRELLPNVPISAPGCLI
jgi:hypothetical protein